MLDYTKQPSIRLSSGQKKRCLYLLKNDGEERELLRYLSEILKTKSGIVSIRINLNNGDVEHIIDKSKNNIAMSIFENDDTEDIISWIDWRIINE